MFSAGIRRSFRATHALRGDFGRESSPHEHAYRVEWCVRARALNAEGFSVDIALCSRILDSALRKLGGVDLNTLPWFEGRQTSLENVALYIDQVLRSGLDAAGVDSAGLAGTRIRLWESDDAWAEYTSP